MKAEIVVDLQFGSTGKGAVCAYLARSGRFGASVRVQSIQAGHTVYYEGKLYKMRTIPCAWVNPEMLLMLGPGCFVDKDLLLEEIGMVDWATGGYVRDRLVVDYRATYVTEADVAAERGLDKKIGSTAHGAGASLVRKLERRRKPTRAIDDSWLQDNRIRMEDSVQLLQRENVLVEGCQGTMLSVHTSPYYPYVTARECTAASP